MVRQAPDINSANSVCSGSHRTRKCPPTKKSGILAVAVAMLAITLAACGGSANQVDGSANNPEGAAGGGSQATTTQRAASVAPDFPMTLYQGEDVLGGTSINFSDISDQAIVLNFWAGLCPPCRAEMPDLQEFYDEFKDEALLVGLDVGQFTGLGNRSDARDLLQELAVSYPAGYTEDGTVMQKYQVLSMPTTVFINSDGTVFRKWSGALNKDMLEKITREMLAQ